MSAILIVVVGLGASLAARPGLVEKIPGAGTDTAAGEKGDLANARTIRQLQNARNTTTTTRRTTPTKPPVTVPGATTTVPPLTVGPTTPTTKPNALPPQTLAIGDSVMLGAAQSLESDIPGIFVDAKVSRQFWDAIPVLQAYKNEGLLPGSIVVHMGTNGAFSDEQFDQIMQVVGNRTIFFVNAREPRTWETEVNNRLAALANNNPKYPNAHVIDWHLVGNQHGDWFVNDGIHLTTAGAHGYAMLIREHLEAGI